MVQVSRLSADTAGREQKSRPVQYRKRLSFVRAGRGVPHPVIRSAPSRVFTSAAANPLPAAPACAAPMVAFSVGFVAAPHTKRPRRGESRRLVCEIRRAATASLPIETCGAPASLFRFDHSCRFSPEEADRASRLPEGRDTAVRLTADRRSGPLRTQKSPAATRPPGKLGRICPTRGKQ